MTTLKIISIYIVGLVSLFIIYLLTKIDTNDKIIKNSLHSKQIYPIYYDNNLNTEWSFNISKNYDETKLYRWRAPKRFRKTRQGIGEGGTGFVPSADLKELMDQLLKEENFNLLASDMISLHRSLPDARSDECKRLSYPEKLPNTSVIIIFHNEAWTTLLRTVWSVVERSPRELIHEIILVDDMSSKPNLKRPLDDYIERIPISIKLIRTTKREGLIRARLIGAKKATGSVLTFFDAHMECSHVWLQPLLARIASDRSVIAVPVLDGISSADMRYTHSLTHIVGFRSSLIFSWMNVPERETIRTHNDTTAPLLTPTMVGCAFSIDREFFFEIGSYDEGMDIWGSENMEISLRVWQCGGSMEIIPCSHVGHLFRESTYSFDGDSDEIKARNNKRLVEVWMSDVKRVYYAIHPHSRSISAGDLTERMGLKTRLKCKDFRWYLDNVYPESRFRKEVIDFVQIKNAKQNKCIDSYSGTVDTPIAVSACHGTRGNQMLFLTNDQMITTRTLLCFGVDDEQQTVKAVRCTYEDSNWWRYDNETKWLVHIPSDQCMRPIEGTVMLTKCDIDDDSFQWDIVSTFEQD